MRVKFQSHACISNFRALLQGFKDPSKSGNHFLMKLVRDSRVTYFYVVTMYSHIIAYLISNSV